jgi:Mn2+/Fe2+ NRAMP family transporter
MQASTSVPVPAILDPYEIKPEDATPPPQGAREVLRQIGPGMILCASIVGSGELIATTTLGAQAGFSALWVILLSCLIKPIVQVELGRITIATGATGLENFNRLPGPRLIVNWAVWAWAVMVAVTTFQIGAMFGSVAQVMHHVLPWVPTDVFVVALLALTLVLLLGGGYQRIESIATVKVALFTLLTLLAAVILVRMPQYFRWNEVMEGLKFHTPPGGLTKAAAVFGITGIGASEFFMYPYWCIEKGYPRFAGRPDGSREWKWRIFGWFRVMQTDALCSMVIYTVATLAFYFLGAGILNGMGLVPSADRTISVLSNMYTETLGPWALWLFYIGAIATLYGTIFASTAAHSRLYADMFRLMGVFQRDDYAARVRYRRRMVWVLTVVPVALYYVFREPVGMVFIGGMAQFLMMPIIAIGTVYLRYRHLPRGSEPGKTRSVLLWLTSAVMVGFVVVYLATLARRS